MAFEDQIVAKLEADAAVSALVGARIYPAPAPQDVLSPFLTYQVVGSDQAGSSYSARAVFDISTLQIDCWHEQIDRVSDGASHFYGAVSVLSRAVRTALDRQGDPTGADAIDGIQFTDWYDLSDEQHARRVCRFDIYVRDP